MPFVSIGSFGLFKSRPLIHRSSATLFTASQLCFFSCKLFQSDLASILAFNGCQPAISTILCCSRRGKGSSVSIFLHSLYSSFFPFVVVQPLSNPALKRTAAPPLSFALGFFRVIGHPNNFIPSPQGDTSMSTVKFIRKTPAGGAGNFNYLYSCTCAGGNAKPNITVTTANDNQARHLAQLECDENCGERLASGSSDLDIPEKEMTKDMESIGPIHQGGQRTWTNYSFQDQVYWSGDRLYGAWSQELSSVCSSAGTSGFYYQLQIISGPEYVGVCSGRRVIKIVTQ